MESLRHRALGTPHRRWVGRCVLAAATTLLLTHGNSTVLAQPTTTPTAPITTSTPPPSADTTTSSTEAPAAEQSTPDTTETTEAPSTSSIPPATSVPTTTPAPAPLTDTPAPPSAAPTTPAPASPGKKEPWVEWTPTQNPNSTIMPGKMRSDRQELPEGFTKEDADKAEIAEAKLLAASRSRNARTTTSNAVAAAAPTDCMVYFPAWQYVVCGEIRVKYDSLGGPNSFLLWPTSNELVNPDQVGRRQTF